MLLLEGQEKGPDDVIITTTLNETLQPRGLVTPKSRGWEGEGTKRSHFLLFLLSDGNVVLFYCR